ncbi:Transcription factor bHLH94 [Hibiscus syriacus]|uniref:Transcription factor bHLH94 n=1 Tax=Hibiscus syriacus TaxID=106335 RepID=A0A6A2YHJ8_HIBSY|nr:transcription factor bHLH94-like [Hibiscus syriacus]KAE8675367.1 Transcription factor bHLH94 [Hibiscus syriacus]
MALEAVVFQQDLFGFSGKELYSLLGGSLSYEQDIEDDKHFHHCNQTSDDANASFVNGDYWVSSSSPTSMAPLPHFSDATNNNVNRSSSDVIDDSAAAAFETTSSRPKRRRLKTRKNKEEIENQRMTHIAVERNRRRQMNEYLSVLRSLMPESYVQRGDQASIVGGAINFVKELEHCVQLLSAKKEVKERSDGSTSTRCCSSPFAEFFTFPQYSTRGDSNSNPTNESMSENRSAIADIEVTMVESHANLKIRSKKGPAQLLKLVSGLSSMRLNILHLNVTTVDQTVLYSLSVKVEDDCKLTSVDDIATAVNELLGRIQEDAMLN